MGNDFEITTYTLEEFEIEIRKLGVEVKDKNGAYKTYGEIGNELEKIWQSKIDEEKIISK